MATLRLSTEHDSSITVGGKSYKCAEDLNTGDVYIRLAEILPEATDDKSTAARKAITDQNPIHFSSGTGLSGYWIKAPAPDEAEKPAAGTRRTFVAS